MDRITAIVLAAGLSRRMGRPKVLLPWGDTTVLGTVVETLAQAGLGEILVVTGAAREQVEGLFYGGYISNGPTTVVEAVASGKNMAVEIDAYLSKQAKPEIQKSTKSYFAMPGYNPVPVSLETDFFGRKIHSPYLLSASPLTDGLDQMSKAYEHGWAGGIMSALRTRRSPS